MSNGKWKCSNCGTENAGEDNFCGECGGKKPESSGWKCPNCGKQDVKSKFCPACGTKKPESKNILTPEQMKAHVTPDREQEKKRRELAEKLRTRASIPITTTTTEEFEPLPYLLLYSMRKGQIIKFGKYAGEELVWSVLDVDISNNTALLINACGLEKMVYDVFFTNWSDDSEIRKWLNETFYDAFTPAEKSKIISRPGGEKVFLLSKEEVEYFCSDDSVRICRSYNLRNALLGSQDASGSVCWWLRSPGSYPNFAMYVDRNGVVCDGSFVHLANCCVRPAILVKF